MSLDNYVLLNGWANLNKTLYKYHHTYCNYYHLYVFLRKNFL